MAYPASGQPVLAAQPVDAGEFAGVAGHDDESTAARVTGDQHVVGADRPAGSFERGADIGGVARRAGVEGEDLDARRQPLDLDAILGRTRRLQRPEQEVGQDDGRYRQAVGLGVETVADRRRAVAQNTDTQVGIEHVARRQSGSRSSATGGGGIAMSMPGASKKSSQTAAAGTMTRRAPSRMIVTSRTPRREGDILGQTYRL